MYELAFNLRTPVYIMLTEMPYEEYRKWIVYLEKRPAGWKEDLRTYHIMRAFGEKKRPEEIFPSLKPILKPETTGNTVVASLKGSAMFMHMMNARGGDKIDFDK
jgi:hypothetical protein